MNTKNLFLATLLSLTACSVYADSIKQRPSPNAIAGEGTNSGGGGDYGDLDNFYGTARQQNLEKKRKESIQIVKQKMDKSIQSGWLKKLFLKTVKMPNFSEYIADESARTTFNAMMSKGLISDIEATPYLLQSSCIEDTTQRRVTLTTKNGTAAKLTIGSPICVDSARFSELYLKDKSELHRVFEFPVWLMFGLFMHDHARHFGFTEDSSHEFAYQLARAYFNFNGAIPTEDYESFNRKPFTNPPGNRFQPADDITLAIPSIDDEVIAKQYLRVKYNLAIENSECGQKYLHGTKARLTNILEGDVASVLFSKVTCYLKKTSPLEESKKLSLGGTKVTVIDNLSGLVILNYVIPTQFGNASNTIDLSSKIIVNFNGITTKKLE